MKKLALLLALVLALSCAAALAETAETTDQPILFRGIPWGISYEELNGQMTLPELAATSATRTIGNLLDGVEDEAFAGRICSMYCQFNDTDGLDALFGDVGGYRLKFVTFYFALIPEEDGSIVQDGTHTALYAARYGLTDPVDPNVQKTVDEGLEDLTAKLSSVYGEPDATGAYPRWRGAEGTMAFLGKSGSTDCKYITYASETGDALLQACLIAETTAAEDAFAANINGL